MRYCFPDLATHRAVVSLFLSFKLFHIHASVSYVPLYIRLKCFNYYLHNIGSTFYFIFLLFNIYVTGGNHACRPAFSLFLSLLSLAISRCIAIFLVFARRDDLWYVAGLQKLWYLFSPFYIQCVPIIFSILVPFSPKWWFLTHNYYILINQDPRY